MIWMHPNCFFAMFPTNHITKVIDLAMQNVLVFLCTNLLNWIKTARGRLYILAKKAIYFWFFSIHIKLPLIDTSFFISKPTYILPLDNNFYSSCKLQGEIAMLKSNLLKYLYGNNSRRQAERLTTCHGVNKT